jgi:hypothetical protein
MIVNEGQMVCVELVAKNPMLNHSKVLFLAAIRYEALKKVYDTRVNIRKMMKNKYLQLKNIF